MAENPNKISQIQVGTITYDICDATVRGLLSIQELDLTVESPFTLYTDTRPIKLFIYYSKIAMLNGVITPISTTDTLFDGVAFTHVPLAYCPTYSVSTLHQASMLRIWQSYIIGPNDNDNTGQVNIGRIRNMNSTSNAAIKNGEWLPFHVTYLIA